MALMAKAKTIHKQTKRETKASDLRFDLGGAIKIRLEGLVEKQYGLTVKWERVNYFNLIPIK